MSQKDKRRAKHKADHGRKKWSIQQRKSRRELGQNFLKDKRVARQIVDQAGVGKDDFVVEFGAGGGIVTGQLAKEARTVMAVEYDPHWVWHLKVRVSHDENVRVVHEDALRVELPNPPFRVVANVPFYITTSMLHRLLDDPTTPLEAVHLLVQKQVALKHARSALTTLKTLNWCPWYRFSAALDVPAGAFHPKPEVDTCLMVATKRGPPLVDPTIGICFERSCTWRSTVAGAPSQRSSDQSSRRRNSAGLQETPSSLWISPLPCSRCASGRVFSTSWFGWSRRSPGLQPSDTPREKGGDDADASGLPGCGSSCERGALASGRPTKP